MIRHFEKDRLQFYRMSVRFIDKFVVIFLHLKLKKKGFYRRTDCLDSSNCLLLYTSKCRNTKTHWFYRFKGAVIDIQISRETVHACLQIFHILFHVVFSPLKYPLYVSLFKAIDQFKQKFRQYVHWCNIVAVRL